MHAWEAPLLLFLALFALFSPVAALSSYFPTVGKLSNADQTRLAVGLFVNVLIFSLVALWVGEPLLHLLGISTAALTATGGIALIYEGVALMRGTHPPQEPVPALPDDTAQSPASWRKYVFIPVTFPLTVGGTTFAFFVGFRAEAVTTGQVLALSVAGVGYAAVTGITLYASGHIQRRASPSTQSFLERIAGILLTAIAVTILASGVTRLVVDVLDGLGR